MLGAGDDARSLLAQLEGMTFPALYPDAVAQCIFDAGPLPLQAPPAVWESLWPSIRHQIADFLAALEEHSGSRGLAREATMALLHRIATQTPSWQPLVALEEARLAAVRDEATRGRAALEATMGELVARLDAAQAERDALRSTIADQSREARELVTRLEESLATLSETGRVIEGQERLIVTLRGDETSARADAEELRTTLEARAAEVARLRASPEHRMGDLLLNRLHLSQVMRLMHGATAGIEQRATLWRLASERLFARSRPRILATVCTDFPIYSQTFVHQELAYLADSGHDVRVAYSQSAPRAGLGGRFEVLWRGRRRLVQHRPIHHRHLLRYERRMPDRVAGLLERLSAASGLPVAALRRHDNVLEGFTFARMAEAYRPAYLHSYFFYDRSLMALIASELLGIPRGVTCYADHLLADYELKVVPLHMHQADLVVATSARIRRNSWHSPPTWRPTGSW